MIPSKEHIERLRRKGLLPAKSYPPLPERAPTEEDWKTNADRSTSREAYLDRRDKQNRRGQP